MDILEKQFLTSTLHFKFNVFLKSLLFLPDIIDLWSNTSNKLWLHKIATSQNLRHCLL